MDQFSSAPDNRRATGFTNLNKYLGANNNTNLDKTIGNKIGQEGTAFQGQVQNAQNQFNTGLDTQKKNIADEQSDIDKTLAAPTSADDDAVKRFAQYRQPGSYSGPTGLANYDTLRGQAQDLNSLNQQARRPESLLSRYLGGNNQYTNGQQNFDRLFLGDSSGIRQGLSQLNRVTPGQLDNFQAGAAGAAHQVQDQRANTTNALRNRLGIDANNQFTNSGVIQDQLNSLDSRVADKQKAIGDTKNQLASTVNAHNFGALTPQQAQLLGLTASDFSAYNTTPTAGGIMYSAGGNSMTTPYGTAVDSGQFYKGNNPGAYETFVDPTTVNRQNVAGQGDLANIGALSKLAGIQQNFLTNDGTLGSMVNTSPVNFNKQGFMDSINRSKGDYNSAMNDALLNYLSTKPTQTVSTNGPSFGGSPSSEQTRLNDIINGVRRNFEV